MKEVWSEEEIKWILGLCGTVALCSGSWRNMIPVGWTEEKGVEPDVAANLTLRQNRLFV